MVGWDLANLMHNRATPKWWIVGDNLMRWVAKWWIVGGQNGGLWEGKMVDCGRAKWWIVGWVAKWWIVGGQIPT